MGRHAKVDGHLREVLGVVGEFGRVSALPFFHFSISAISVVNFLSIDWQSTLFFLVVSLFLGVERSVGSCIG